MHPPAYDDRVLRGLVVDWGGVLTAPVDEVMSAWARHEGIEVNTYRSVLGTWLATSLSPIHRLERGQLAPSEFERLLAAEFSAHGCRVEPDGLLTRMLEGLGPVRDDMVTLLRQARAVGIRTALLSNSWGEHYPEHLWVGAFDEVVISGRVGMRKPEAEIFRHTAKLLRLQPSECVMVDDVAANIRGAVAVGMVGVLYRDFEQAAEEIEILMGQELR